MIPNRPALHPLVNYATHDSGKANRLVRIAPQRLAVGDKDLLRRRPPT